MDRYLPIRDLFAREIIDAVGSPAVEVEMLTDENIVGTASISLTEHVRGADRMESSQESLHSKGTGAVSAAYAVENINCFIAQKLIGINVVDQAEIDRALFQMNETTDGNLSSGSVTMAVSAAAARTAASALDIPLYRYLGGTQAVKMPTPIVDVITGGPYVRNMPDFRGFMVIPLAEGAFHEKLRTCIQVYHELERILRSKGAEHMQECKNDMQPVIRDAQEALALIRSAVEHAAYPADRGVGIVLDIDASAMYDMRSKTYTFPSEGRKRGCMLQRTTEEMMEYYRKIISEFPVFSIEDPFAPEDRNGWENLSPSLSDKVQIVSGNPSFVDFDRKGVPERKNAVVRIDVGKAETVTNIFDQIKKARETGALIEITHMGNWTADTLAADVAVAAGAGYIRAGLPRGIENAEKYNRLLKIEEQFPFYPSMRG